VVRALLSLIQAEFMKLKRKLVILIALLSSALPPLINILYTLNLPENSSINATFKDFYQSSFTFTEWILLPCVLGMIGSILIFNERENGTLKELMIIPVNKALLLLSKLSILFVFSILFMFLTAIFTVAGALIVGYSDMTAAWIFRLFEISVKTGILTAFSTLPIVFITVAAKQGYIFPTCATLIYSISGLIFASDLMGIHPLASVAGILWYKNIEGIEMSTNLMMCVLNIVIVSILSFIASVFVLKKQNY
jgi:hypothetical protein